MYVSLKLFIHIPQVSQLIILNETTEREGGKLPNLIPFAQTVLRATEDLVHVGHKLARDTDDEVENVLLVALKWHGKGHIFKVTL